MLPVTPIATGVTPERLAGLRRWNLGLALLHFAQAVAILLLAGSFAITVTTSIPEGPPGTAVPAPASLFDVPIGVAVAVFLALAALDHLLTATVYRSTYERDLKRGINRFRLQPGCGCTRADEGGERRQHRHQLRDRRVHHYFRRVGDLGLRLRRPQLLVVLTHGLERQGAEPGVDRRAPVARLAGVVGPTGCVGGEAG